MLYIIYFSIVYEISKNKQQLADDVFIITFKTKNVAKIITVSFPWATP